MPDFVAYYRTSTARQDYGIDAQRRDVLGYIEGQCGTLVAEFSEKESGKRADRPQMLAAIATAKASGAALIFSKLDRLSRDAGFIFALKAELDREKVKIVCVAIPDLNTLTLGIFATIAQHEREVISARTVAGLESARLKGKKLGGYRGRQKSHVREAINAGIAASVAERDKEVLPTIRALASDGKTQEQISDFLNATGKKTFTGKAFSRQQVGIVLRRNGA
ncbi:MAG TPA: recombinase family protein [Patescibacteria group bacterium]|nr:recombinase family protein [Patescibacteria group bacterium]